MLTITLPSLLVQCNACQVDIGFVKVVCFFTFPVIGILGQRPPANVCPDLATEPFNQTISTPFVLNILMIQIDNKLF